VASYFPIQPVYPVVPDIKETSVPKSSPPTFLSDLRNLVKKKFKAVIRGYVLFLLEAPTCSALYATAPKKKLGLFASRSASAGSFPGSSLVNEKPPPKSASLSCFTTRSLSLRFPFFLRRVITIPKKYTIRPVLMYLHPLVSILTSCKVPMDNLSSIRRIVLCLLRFDLWAADTIADELNTQQRLENFEYHFQRIWRGLPPVKLKVLEEWLQSPELYHIQPVAALREHVETFSEQQLYSVIMNSSTKPTYTRLLFKRIEKLVEQKAINGFATQHPDRAFEELQGLLLAQRPATRAEYIVTLAHRLHEAHLRLKAVIREAKVFRECIEIAQEAGDLQFPPALQVLREKLEALNEHYEDAFRVLEEVMSERLMNTQISQFWSVTYPLLNNSLTFAGTSAPKYRYMLWIPIQPSCPL
jgi:hypothetical protein